MGGVAGTGNGEEEQDEKLNNPPYLTTIVEIDRFDFKKPKESRHFGGSYGKVGFLKKKS